MGLPEFWKACGGGDPGLVQEQLQQHHGSSFDPNDVGPRGFTGLYLACLWGHARVVGVLLADARVDLNRRSGSSGCTPLQVACYMGHLEAAALLLADPRIDPNHADHGRCTPLYDACKQGHPAIARLLLRHPKLDRVQAQDDVRSAFILACAAGHAGVVGILLECCPWFNPTNCTSLWQACRMGRVEVVRLLLACRPSRHEHPMLLEVARQHQHQDIVQLLEAHMQDPAGTRYRLCAELCAFCPLPIPQHR